VHALLFLKYGVLACPLKQSRLHVALEVVSNSGAHFVPICDSCTTHFTCPHLLPIPTDTGLTPSASTLHDYNQPVTIHRNDDKLLVEGCNECSFYPNFMSMLAITSAIIYFALLSMGVSSPTARTLLSIQVKGLAKQFCFGWQRLWP